jgi:hypothetical protein
MESSQQFLSNHRKAHKTQLKAAATESSPKTAIVKNQLKKPVKEVAVQKQPQKSQQNAAAMEAASESSGIAKAVQKQPTEKPEKSSSDRKQPVKAVAMQKQSRSSQLTAGGTKLAVG